MIKKWLAKLCRGLKATAETEHYTKTGRFLGNDPEFPNTYRPELKTKVKAVAAAALIATVASTGQAGSLFAPGGGESAPGGFWGPVWNWWRSNFGFEQFVQSVTASGQPTPQAVSNIAGSTFSSAPVPAPNGPGGGSGGNPLIETAKR